MKALRKFIEYISRGRILKREIKTKHGRFIIYVSPDAQLKYWKFGNNAFDSDLVRIAENLVQKHDVVWDVGANVGVFTFACAFKSESTILSIEADVWLSSLITKTSHLPTYAGKDLRILPAAVSRSDGVAEFIVAARGRASNALASAGGRSQMGGTRFRSFVPTLRLDTIAENQPRPDFIKIDVEGAEFDVLKGAQELINAKKPNFYIEIGAEAFDAVFQYMASHSYIAYDEYGHRCQTRVGSNYFFAHENNHHFQDLIRKFRRAGENL